MSEKPATILWICSCDEDAYNAEGEPCQYCGEPYRAPRCPVHGSLLIDGECPACKEKAAHRREQSEKKPEGKG